jgi:guanylate kinase
LKPKPFSFGKLYKNAYFCGNKRKTAVGIPTGKIERYIMSPINKGKVLIFSAPSGSGKSTVVGHILSRRDDIEFSVSATSRPPRGQEQDGREYYFLSVDEFRRRIAEDMFVEYQEVYEGRFYGTLKSEVERIWAKGHAIAFDVDVKGGVNLKKYFGDNALSVFIQAPSVEELRRRLVGRGTDSPEEIDRRIAKASEEMTYAPKFDRILVNDDLATALAEADAMVDDFLNRP